MKNFIFILAMTYSLFATPIFSIPDVMKKEFCQQLAYDTNCCDKNATLDYAGHFMMKSGDLLLFMRLNEHDTEAPLYPTSTLFLMVDKNGKFIKTKGENNVSEVIESVHQDSNGEIWIVAHWQIEGVYPIVLHSHDGSVWKAILLPENRKVNCCFERLDKLCFQENSIALTFTDLDNEVVKSWKSTYQSAISSNPTWESVVTVPTNCLKETNSTAWSIKKSENTITFTHKQTKIDVVLNTFKEK